MIVFFCLGKDISDELGKHNQMRTHFNDWINFDQFLKTCVDNEIDKLYITGQNTDPLLYPHLKELITYLKSKWFQVGMRTNGANAIGQMDTINMCNRSVGYTLSSLDPTIHKMITGTSHIPHWDEIIPATENCRIQIVVNRCNINEFWKLLQYATSFKNVKYVQIRRISTDKRFELLAPDIAAYEKLYTQVASIFPVKETLWQDAQVFNIYGKDVVFWRTVKTSVNSFNYFTDGTISKEYFIVEGYLNNSTRMNLSET